MIRSYKNINNELQLINTPEKDCWINLLAPTEQEIQDICIKYAIPADFITDALDSDEIARLEFDEDNFLIVSRIPVCDPSNQELPIYTVPLAVIVIPNEVLITVCAIENELIASLHDKKFGFSPNLRDKSILQIFSRTIQLYIRYLKQIKALTSEIEKDLKESMKNSELIRLFDLEKILIQFRASLNSNYRMLQKMQRSRIFKLNEKESDLLDDIMIDNVQAMETADIYSNILNEMMDFFSSLLSNNLNMVMKFLTAVTILISIPTLITSTFGMNVDLPFQHSAHAFLLVGGISLFAVIIGVFIFFYRKWV